MITSWKFISAIKNGISWTQIFHSFNSLSNWKLGFQTIFQERSSWVWIGPVLSSYRSLVQVPCLLARSFVLSFVCLFVCTFVDLTFVRSFARSLVRSLSHSPVHSFLRSYFVRFARWLRFFLSFCLFVRSFVRLFLFSYWLIRESSLVWFFLCILANFKREKYCFVHYPSFVKVL